MQPSEQPPVMNRPYACVKGERGYALWAYQPEWYRESRLFVPGTAGVFYLGSVPAGTAKGLIARPLETFSPNISISEYAVISLFF